MNRLLLALLTLSIVLTYSRDLAAEESDLNQSPSKLTATVQIEMDYLVYLPQEYEQESDWPLLWYEWLLEQRRGSVQ